MSLPRQSAPPEPPAAAPAETPPEPAAEAPPPRWRRMLRRLVQVSVVAAMTGAASLAGAFWYLSWDLPDFETLEDYAPPQTTRLLDADGELVGTLFRERRTVVPLEEIPPVLIRAVVAAEDEGFYQHEGLDYLGILRAAVKNVLAGRVKEGASTITQQVVKTFLLTPERKFRRKMREMILARRLEKNLTKDEILYLYLNQIYFGHGRYGVEEASRYYFGKPVRDIGLGEAAILAGLPKAPAYYSPRRYPKKAKERRSYVLGRMVEAGFITRAEADVADEAPVEVSELPLPPPGATYVEEVRRELESQLGTETLLEGGLTVRLGMRASHQRAAEQALRDALHALDRRQGWRGALLRVAPEKIPELQERFDAARTARAERLGRDEPLLWDLSELVGWGEDRKEEPPVEVQLPEAGALVTGLVSDVDSARQTARVELGGGHAVVTRKSVKWARPFDTDRQTDPPLSIADVLAVGDLVWMRLGETAPVASSEDESGDSQEISAELAQVPAVQGALVAIDPRSRAVTAMVGGYDPTESRFNRATQGKRQPGSSFKPFVYGAAIDSGAFTAASRVLDAPEVFHDPWTGKVWKPENYSERFEGEMSLRRALARSKNIVSVRLIDAVGVDTVIDFARRAGIESSLPRVLPLALGAGEVSLMELVNAYATIAALGVRDRPALFWEVVDGGGVPLRAHRPAPESTIRPAVAWVLADLMQSVMREGTGQRLNRLDRPVAGKTGTANDQRDAWFVGFTPELVAGVWVGFDTPAQLGPNEYGARAAGPAWLAFMQSALEGEPPDWLDPPEGVSFVRVDAETGLLAPVGRDGDFEAFVAGTEPLEEAPASDALSPTDFLLADPREAP